MGGRARDPIFDTREMRAQKGPRRVQLCRWFPVLTVACSGRSPPTLNRPHGTVFPKERETEVSSLFPSFFWHAGFMDPAWLGWWQRGARSEPPCPLCSRLSLSPLSLSLSLSPNRYNTKKFAFWDMFAIIAILCTYSVKWTSKTGMWDPNEETKGVFIARPRPIRTYRRGEF